MMAFLFTRKFSRFDGLAISGGTLLLSHGHWLLFVLVAVAGSFVSVSGEGALAQRRAA